VRARGSTLPASEASALAPPASSVRVRHAWCGKPRENARRAKRRGRAEVVERGESGSAPAASNAIVAIFLLFSLDECENRVLG